MIVIMETTADGGLHQIDIYAVKFGLCLVCKSNFDKYNDPLDMKECICQFVKWQIHPFIHKGSNIGHRLE